MSGEAVATALGVVVTTFAVIAALWRYVVLPNLREQLFDPIRENNRQLTENRHTNAHPTILDKFEDMERTLRDATNHVDMVALNQLAVLRRLGEHIGESEADRRNLWLIIGSLIHEEKGK